MKKLIRIFSFAIGLTLSMNIAAQNAKSLTNDGNKAQKALVEYLRSISLTPSIDTRDNSVCFKSGDVFFWVTFDGNSPVLYTIHRKGLKFDTDPAFKVSIATIACNEVNRRHYVKCVCKDKRIEFVMQTYAKEPSDFHGGFRKMLNAFKDVEVTFKKAYEQRYDRWRKDSIAAHKPIMPDTPVGNSPLKVTYIAFGNFDAVGNVISDYNQPLRKSACRFIKASVNVSSSEKGIFKLGMRIVNPDGKAMVANKGVDYCSATNIEIKKTSKEQEYNLDSYGSDKPGFWKAGEYKVEIFDFEKGVQLFTTTFNIL